MRAFQLSDSGTLLFSENIADPQPGPQEILVRVHAAGVTPTELQWYPTTHTPNGTLRLRAIPGHEFSGTVVALGSEATDVAIGDEVYGMSDWFADGATAEFCLTRPPWVAPKPSGISHVEAASVPIGALTAWQGLVDRAKLQKDEHVLIHGGAGAVGVFAVQLAHRLGAHTTVTASARNADFLRALGADVVIDYHATRFEEGSKDFDVIFDTVGGDTRERSWPLLAPHGRMVTVAADDEGHQDARTKSAFFIVEPNREQLISIGKLLAVGDFKAVVDAIVPFENAPDAYARRIDSLGRGKVVLKVIQ